MTERSIPRSAQDRHAVTLLAAAKRGAGHAENAIETLAAIGRVGDAMVVAEAYYLGRGFSVGRTRYSSQQGSYTTSTRRETKLLFSPSTEGLRSHRGFPELLADIGLTEYWSNTKTHPDLRTPN